MMDESDDDSSQASELVGDIFGGGDEAAGSTQAIDIIEDVTRDDGSLSDEGSLDSLDLNDGAAPVIKPRAYQIEMVEESLKRNIIVAVS